MLPHNVTYYQKTGMDEYGAPSYDAGTQYRARVVWSTKRVSDFYTGQEAVAQSYAWVNAALMNLKVDDKFLLPDGSTPKILAWEIYPDEFDNRFTKVFFGGEEQ